MNELGKSSLAMIHSQEEGIKWTTIKDKHRLMDK